MWEKKKIKMEYISKNDLINELRKRYTEMWESNDISLGSRMDENADIQDLINTLPVINISVDIVEEKTS